jgi:hypothetical protein
MTDGRVPIPRGAQDIAEALGCSRELIALILKRKH